MTSARTRRPCGKPTWLNKSLWDPKLGAWYQRAFPTSVTKLCSDHGTAPRVPLPLPLYCLKGILQSVRGMNFSGNYYKGDTFLLR